MPISYLRLINKKCKNPIFASYDHIEINNQIYTIKGILPKIEELNHDKNYFEYDIKCKGKLTQSKGNMPNPMVETLVIELESLEVIRL